jgi:NifU-like protein involved in Fe-S cluster formation
MMAIEYTDKVKEHFMHPKNVGEIENPSGIAMEGSPACGDMVSLTIKVNKDTQIIEDIKFKSYGCASNIATSSALTEIAKGKKVEDAKNITWKEVMEDLGGLPTVKVHCSVLAVDTLKSAIKDYEKKNGLLKYDPDVLNKDNLREKLKSVVNPATGADIISSNMVKSYEVSEGKININLNICKSHEYAENIEEEIEEHVSNLNGFKEIEIRYSCN